MARARRRAMGRVSGFAKTKRWTRGLAINWSRYDRQRSNQNSLSCSIACHYYVRLIEERDWQLGVACEPRRRLSFSFKIGIRKACTAPKNQLPITALRSATCWTEVSGAISLRSQEAVHAV